LVGEGVVEVVVVGVAVAVGVLRQEHPLDNLDARPEQAVAHAGRVGDAVAVVYVEQKGAASVDDLIIARWSLLEEEGNCNSLKTTYETVIMIATSSIELWRCESHCNSSCEYEE
jgi:hypothetical protein